MLLLAVLWMAVAPHKSQQASSTNRAEGVTGGSTQDGIEESRHGSQVYTRIQILARDVKRFTPALCEQVEG